MNYIMVNRLLFLLFLVALFQWDAQATRPMRRTFPVKQVDGTTLWVERHGSSQSMFYSTIDAKAIVRGKDGGLYYAVLSNGSLIPSDFCAHMPELRSEEENQFVEYSSMDVLEAYSCLKTLSNTKKMDLKNESVDGFCNYGVSNPNGVVNSIGTPLIPVIMVEFPDRSFLPETTIEKVSRFLNENGYDDEKHCKGSVKDYFASQSDSLFVPSFEVVAKVQASREYAYYGANGSSGSIDLNCKVLIQEAIDSAMKQGVDFSKFAEGNSIPLVSIYYAGPGEHSSYEMNCEDYIWAHFSERTFKAGDISISSYFVGNESLQSYQLDEHDNIVPIAAAFDGMGVFVHEFGHALGLPDFYYTGNSSMTAQKIKSPDLWSIMDYGQYMYDGYAPIGYSAYERAMMGWQKFAEPSIPGYYELYAFHDKAAVNTAYLLKNPEKTSEYYILENRQPDTWYPAMMGHGMLVFHVDYDKSKWLYNTVNNDPDHQRYQLIAADNVYSYFDSSEGAEQFDNFKGDLFPGLSNVTELSDDSTPSMSVYTGNSLEKPIFDIKEVNGVICFCFKDKTLVGISEVTSSTNGNTEIYTLSGKKVITTRSLSPGVYIMKQEGLTKKVMF